MTMSPKRHLDPT